MVGAAGVAGAWGACGAAGVVGADGVEGALGAGDAGAVGAFGGVGALGGVGAAGAFGAGAAGALGGVGALGAAGVAGAWGACGVAGGVGADGVEGALGAGAAGAAGASGALGAAGAAGVLGAAGAEADGAGVLGATEVGASASGAALVPVDFWWRTGVARKALGWGLGRVPVSSREMELRSITATSLTLVAGAESCAKDFTPPVIMTLQKGQPVAISSAPVSKACSVRKSLMRVPSFSSMNMRAPPAPQQKASSRFLSISRSSTPVASSSSRGGSKTLLWRPRKQGSW